MYEQIAETTCAWCGATTFPSHADFHVCRKCYELKTRFRDVDKLLFRETYSAMWGSDRDWETL